MWTTIYFLIIAVIVFYYAALEAFKEACLYDLRSRLGTHDKPWKGDEHNRFLMQRTIVFILFVTLNRFILGTGIHAVLFDLFIMLMFYVFHVGMYYRYRNEMNGAVYQMRFRADDVPDPGQPKTFELKWKYRKWILVASIGMYIASYIITMVR